MRPAGDEERRLLRGAVAGAGAAAVWAAVEPVASRLFATRYSDVRLVGRPVSRRHWRPAGIAIHLANGAVAGMAFERLGLRGWKAGLVAAQVENAVLWPVMVLVDRFHPDRRSGAWPPLLRNARVFGQEAAVHAVFGVVLGALGRGYDPRVRLVEQIVVARSAAETFPYVADFENTARWDPGVAEARKLTDGPVRVGSEFDVVAVFRGKRQRFRYRVTELDDGRRIVLSGDGEKATSVDTIVVEPDGGGSRITYAAELRLKGLRRLAGPLLKPVLAKTADEGLAGLKATLDRPA